MIIRSHHHHRLTIMNSCSKHKYLANIYVLRGIMYTDSCLAHSCISQGFIHKNMVRTYNFISCNAPLLQQDDSHSTNFCGLKFVVHEYYMAQTNMFTSYIFFYKFTSYIILDHNLNNIHLQ
jgi:hypothetical protein